METQFEEFRSRTPVAWLWTLSCLGQNAERASRGQTGVGGGSKILFLGDGVRSLIVLERIPGCLEVLSLDGRAQGLQRFLAGPVRFFGRKCGQGIERAARRFEIAPLDCRD